MTDVLVDTQTELALEAAYLTDVQSETSSDMIDGSPKETNHDPEVAQSAASDVGETALAAAETVRERSPATLARGGGVAIYGAFPGQRRFAGQGVNGFRRRRNFIAS